MRVVNGELDARDRHPPQAAATQHERGDADQPAAAPRDADQRLAMQGRAGPLGPAICAVPRLEYVERGEDRALLHAVLELLPFTRERGHIRDAMDPGDGQRRGWGGGR